MQYKALSLLQPWASLSVLGLKQFETRSWNTTYRGPLLIHASAGKQGLSVMDDPEFKKHLMSDFKEDPRQSFKYGAIIGIVNIVNTCSTTGRVIDDEFFRECGPGIGHADRLPFIGLTTQEAAFGDYSAGRYGWEMCYPAMFNQAIPAKGKLGLWNPDEATSELVTEALQAIGRGAAW